MKKVLLLLLTMLSVTFAEVKVTQFVEAGFEGFEMRNLPWDYECSKSLQPVDGDYWTTETFYSALDSNVFFSTNEAPDVWGDFYLTFWVLSSATHSLGEVIRYQFKLFKECEIFVDGKIRGTEDDPTDRLDGIADTAATLIDSALKKYDYVAYESECTYYFNGPCVDYRVDYYLPSEIQAIIDEQNGKTALNTRKRYRVDFNLSDGHLDVPEQMIGRKFQMYDASGRRLVDDRLQNTLDLPSAPRYIKIRVK